MGSIPDTNSSNLWEFGQELNERVVEASLQQNGSQGVQRGLNGQTGADGRKRADGTVDAETCQHIQGTKKSSDARSMDVLHDDACTTTYCGGVDTGNVWVSANYIKQSSSLVGDGSGEHHKWGGILSTAGNDLSKRRVWVCEVLQTANVARLGRSGWRKGRVGGCTVYMQFLFGME